MAVIGQRVADARRRAGLTLAQAAARNGVSPAYISQIESGSANPTVRALAQVATGLDTDVAGLFGSAGDAPEPVFEAYHSPFPLLAGVAGAPAVWDLTAEGAQLLSARLVHAGAADHAEPVTHGGEELIVVLAGSCRVHVDGVSRVLGPGSACHLAAAQPHHISGISADLTMSVVMAGGSR